MSELDEPKPERMPRHVSVMLSEAIDLLAPRPGHVVVDGTVGAGGHAVQIAQRIEPGGLLICLDRDPSMLELARRRVTASTVKWFEADYAEIRQVLDEVGVERVDGVLMDLGVASDQIETAERGFSFARPGPLDMRMNPLVGEPASRLVNKLRPENLADIFYQYGEERHSRRIAREIAAARERKPIETTDELAQIVRRATPRSKGRERIDPATRVFQALRIAVNHELDSLERAMEVLHRCVKPGGRAVVISFHSLEDRIVKRTLRNSDHWELVVRKPLVPTEREVEQNPRARSAKLRAATRK